MGLYACLEFEDDKLSRCADNLIYGEELARILYDYDYLDYVSDEAGEDWTTVKKMIAYLKKLRKEAAKEEDEHLDLIDDTIEVLEEVEKISPKAKVTIGIG